MRLFQNDPRIRFEGALHEVVDHSLGRHGCKLGALDVPVHHYGPLDSEREHDKAGTYYELAKHKLALAPHDEAALFELAVQAGVVGQQDEAIALWTRYVKLPHATRLELAWMNLGHAYLETNQFELSSRASREALSLDAACNEAAFNLALCELSRGRHGEALTQCEKLLARLPGHAAALGVLAAASVLTKDSARLARASGALVEAGVQPAAVLMSFADRSRRAGRGGDARQLTMVARQLWKETLAAQGLSTTDAELEQLLLDAATAAPRAESNAA